MNTDSDRKEDYPYHWQQVEFDKHLAPAPVAWWKRLFPRRAEFAWAALPFLTMFAVLTCGFVSGGYVALSLVMHEKPDMFVPGALTALALYLDRFAWGWYRKKAKAT